MGWQWLGWVLKLDGWDVFWCSTCASRVALRAVGGVILFGHPLVCRKGDLVSGWWFGFPLRSVIFLPLTVAIARSPLRGLALGRAIATVRGRKLP